MISVSGLVGFGILAYVLGLVTNLVVQSVLRRRCRPLPLPEPPRDLHCFTGGFVLPIVDDLRWVRKKAEDGLSFALGTFVVEQRYLNHRNMVLPRGIPMGRVRWVVILVLPGQGERPLPVRLDEAEEYGEALRKRFEDDDRRALLAQVQCELERE